MDNETTFPIYQYSEFIKDGKGQLVIRENSWIKFLEAKKNIDTIVTKVTTPFVSEPEKTAPLCGIHGTPLIWKTGVSKKTGNSYAFWTCPTKNADGTFCTYKPDKDPINK